MPVLLTIGNTECHEHSAPVSGDERQRDGKPPTVSNARQTAGAAMQRPVDARPKQAPQARPAWYARLRAAAVKYRLGVRLPGVNGPPASPAPAINATAVTAAWPVARSGPGRQPGAAGPAACMGRGRGGGVAGSSGTHRAGQDSRHPAPMCPCRAVAPSLQARPAACMHVPKGEGGGVCYRDPPFECHLPTYPYRKAVPG